MKKFLRLVHLYVVFSGDIRHEDGTLAWREERFDKIIKASTVHGKYHAKRGSVKPMLDYESWEEARPIFWFESAEEVPETCPDDDFGFASSCEGEGMFEGKNFEDFEMEKFIKDYCIHGNLGFDEL